MRNLLKMCGHILASSLLLGVFFIPLRANAGFLASILGSETSSAQSNTVESVDNSQTMELLQANVSSISLAQDKKDSKKDNIVDENKNIKIVSDNAILPATGPLGVSDGKVVLDSFAENSVYVVRKGDTLSQIASMYGVSVNTILWANDMKKGSVIKEGDILFILPISGLEHTVTKGQTLKSIAKLYKVDISEIIQNNDITEDTKLAVGDKLLVPDATKTEEGGTPVKNLNASIAKDKQYYTSHPLPKLAGYFINPVPGYRKSQGIHDKNAIDMAIAKGTPIRAAAAGQVILARNGYNGGFGNLVIIYHPNGTETLYAHQSKILTKTGAQVAQGEIIGLIGSTGRSTGPHLHFEVHGAQNPGVDGSWAN